ncbi:hypothetical protein R6Q57_023434 [Mikania cordata]
MVFKFMLLLKSNKPVFTGHDIMLLILTRKATSIQVSSASGHVYAPVSGLKGQGSSILCRSGEVCAATFGQIQCIKSQAMNHSVTFQHQIVRLIKKLAMVQLEENVAVHVTLFDIDMENSNVCKVVDSYMARAWRAHCAKLHAHFKEIGGSKEPTKAKASPPYNISKEDWETLCDMWCGATFLVKLTHGVLHIGKKKKAGYPKKPLQHM